MQLANINIGHTNNYPWWDLCLLAIIEKLTILTYILDIFENHEDKQN